MQPEERPLSVREIVSHSLRAYQWDAPTVIGVTILAGLPTLAGAELVSSLIQLFFSLAVIKFYHDRYVDGSGSWKDGVQLAKSKFFLLVGVMILVSLVLFASFGLVLLSGFLAAKVPQTLLILLPLVVALVIYLSLTSFFLVPALALEDLSVTESIRRAFYLARGHRMRILAIQSVALLPLLLLLPILAMEPQANEAVSAFKAMVASSLLIPFWIGVSVVAYVDRLNRDIVS